MYVSAVVLDILIAANTKTAWVVDTEVHRGVFGAVRIRVEGGIRRSVDDSSGECSSEEEDLVEHFSGDCDGV